ncbi:MAG: mandelate racemase/muconate lactonizing enzyme family protein [Caldilineaceae bacterium]|nr:mandelate racemase/muconate lactonizing enzyme family protein [Caldilineaceae bacterium]
MRISAIETYILQSPLERPFGWSQGWIDTRSTGLVKIITDEGVVGWGEGCDGAAATIVGRAFAPLLLGQDPTNRVGLWHKMFCQLYNSGTTSGIGGSALSAVDIALWDIAGQAAGLSVSDLLGGRIRDRVPVYATGLYYTDGEFPDRLLQEARTYVEMGFLGMKTKVGGLPLQKDVERVAALRDAIGPDVYLSVDANQAYNAATAIHLGERLADYDILWFEEPVNARDIDAYLQVKAALPMAIAGGEVLRMRYEFKDFLARRAFDIAQPDVAHVGGITEMRRVAEMANAFGVQVNPHVWASPIMIAATLHVAAVIPPCPPARDPQPFLQEPTMEFDRTPSPIREELCRRPFEQIGGYVTVPTGPGLGIEVDQRVVDRLAVARERYTE